MTRTPTKGGLVAADADRQEISRKRLMLSVAITCAGAGFLLAVLWFDLMFDSRVWRYRHALDAVPEETLATITAYYRQVTTEARPMPFLVAGVMFATVAAALAQAIRAPAGERTVSIVAILLVGSAIADGLLRLFPAAVRLGTRRDPVPVQGRLAWLLLRDHVFCFAAVLAFLVLQLMRF